MIFTKEKKDISAGSNKPQSLFERLKNKALDIWEYCSKGVWEDKRDTLKIRIVKTLNLTIRTFMSADLQSKACAMTYRTLLAIVPALALLLPSDAVSDFKICCKIRFISTFRHNARLSKWPSLSLTPVSHRLRKASLSVSASSSCYGP